MKTFLIVFGSLISIFVVAVIVVISVLSAKIDKTDFQFSMPDSIKIFNKSYDSTSIDSENENFNNLINSLNGAMEVSKLEQLVSGNKINKKVRVGNKVWSADLKQKNVCIQLSYNTKKSLIIYDNKDSKKIEYNYLIIVLNGSDEFVDHDIYYSTSLSFVNCESLVVCFNEKNLYKYI